MINKKIAFIAREFPPYSTSGIAVYAEEFYRRLKEKYNTVLFTQNYRGMEKNNIRNIETIGVKGINSIIRLLFLLRKEKNIDLVISNGFGSSIVAALSKFTIKKPIICIVQDVSSADPLNFEMSKMKKMFISTIYSAILKISDRIVAISNKTSNECINYLHVKKEKMTVCPYGPNQIFYKESKNYRKSKNKIFTILFIGPFYKKRGFEYFLQAVKLLEKTGIKFQCIACGPRIDYMADKVGYYKEYYEYIDRLLKDPFLRENVKFENDYSKKNLVKLYKKCDILVNTTYHSEGLGLPFIEAGLFGKPSVGTTIHGDTGVVVDGKTGLLAKPMDYHSVYLAIKKLATDEKLRNNLGKNARRHALTFSWDNHMETIIKTIDKIFKKE